MKKLILALAVVTGLATGLVALSSVNHALIPAAYACEGTGCS
jgi:hypothetical protein